MLDLPSAPGGPQAGRRAEEPATAGAQERLTVSDLHPHEVAEALWLAVNHPRLAAFGRPPRPTPTTPPMSDSPSDPPPDADAGPPDPPPAPDEHDAEAARPDAAAAPDADGADAGTEATGRAPGASGDVSGAMPGAAPPGVAPVSGLAARAAPGRAAEEQALTAPGLAAVDAGGPADRPRLPRRRAGSGAGASAGGDAAALGRALRPLRRRIRSARERVVDEEGTAERLAQAAHLPPLLRPGLEPRWSAVLLVDTAGQMGIWRATARRFAGALRRYGGFRDVELRTLDTSAPTPAGLVLRGPGRTGRAQPWQSLVEPSGRRIVLVLTDGLAPGWHTGAAQSLLAAWARHQPVAVLHTLPQRLWQRTGLSPERVRLLASGPWPAHGRVGWEFTGPEPPAPYRDPERSWRPDALRGARSGASVYRRLVPIPVLEVSGDWIAPWARFVAGEWPRWAEVAAVLAGPWTAPESVEPAPPEWAPRVLSAAERVGRFRVWASPEAFDLATRLAAVQLDLPVISSVQRHTLPRTGPAHLAEFLMSGLVEPLPGSGDRSFSLHAGVREELLASGTRQATQLASRTAAEVLAPHSGAARDLLAHLDGGKASREPEVNRENLRFREVEYAVLQALSGAHLRRARQLRGLIESFASTMDQPFQMDRPYHSADSAGRAKSTHVTPITSEVSGTVNPPGTPDNRNAFEGAPVPSSQGGVGGFGASLGGTTVTTTSPAPTPPATGGAPARQSRVAGVRPAVWGNMPPRNLVFTGREELLLQLERELSEGPTAVLPHALHGMGGVGKSQLALEYVYRHADQYDIVWWIPAERPTQIAQALVELARRLHLPVSGEAITAVPAVLEALRTGAPYSNWLLVFDNAESPEAVREYFPTSPGSSPIGSILVTSRNPQWETLAHPLEVDVFERSESIHLLQRRNPDLPADEADQLAEVLGDLPLAVEQASAWRAETGMPASEYLRLFEEKRSELMTVSPPTHYEETVATAWNVSLDYLERKNAAALQLLQVCSYFAPEPIARSLFSGAAVEPIAPDLDRALTDPLRLGRAIREIHRYSLAKIDHRTNSIQMHRLVQAVLIARMTDEQRQRMRHGAHLLLAANTPRDAQDREHWPRFADLYPHIVVSEAMASSSRTVRQTVCNVVEYLFYWGDHEGARDYGQRVHDLWREQHGEADRQTLMLGRHLRFILWAMGRYEEAARLNERMLAVLQTSGPDAEEELLRARGQVAIDLRARGEFAEALRIDRELYDRAVQVYGDEDPETLTHAHNLAVCLRVNGDFREALELDRLTWQRKTQMFGEDALSSLGTELSVALDRRDLGEYAVAAQLCETAVEKFRAGYGDNSPHTLRAMTRLGESMRKAGQHDRAVELTSYARKALTDRYGERHPDSLAAALSLSIDMRQLGDLSDALQLGERTRDLYVEIFGPEHPHTNAANMDLAVTYRLLNKVDTARKLNEAALALCVRRLGERHPDGLVCRTNLASDLFAQGDIAAACEMDQKTLEITIDVLGAQHPSALALKSNLAQDLKALGRFEEAEAMHTETLEGLSTALGDTHPAWGDAVAWRRANCDADPLPI
ncbi:FxSxx-COOH system tetratricopeptide repeat protein [Streptomyces sp. LX-29]|uniref:FxSxx-COOH system tetratricopeptide repeat protein n=1 Tax=Streptomyces sp. LX-29 TaxID=2900152 RepID=UPI00240DF9C5|nr:FxSxx-COOH system tetratricopeptide repeat protein [Streptomyces sp. LX-29]WFB06724.1 FxSxx-COOH system tetratricopeptide repeat protein [Streptomyces sp. LX-29]